MLQFKATVDCDVNKSQKETEWLTVHDNKQIQHLDYYTSPYQIQILDLIFNMISLYCHQIAVILIIVFYPC